MALRRYARTPKMDAGRMYGTARGTNMIFERVKSGAILSRRYVTSEGERLDILAGAEYGDARLWWVIAAASGIGWAVQVPGGVVLNIPRDLGQIANIVG